MTKKDKIKLPPPNSESAAEFRGRPFPSAMELSMLAAQPRFGNFTNEIEALRAAISMWRTAEWFLDERKKFEIWRAQTFRHEQFRPKKWPAPFNDFLRLIVGGKDEAEQLSRFRRYTNAEAEKHITNYCNEQQQAELLTPEALLDGQEKAIARYRAAGLSNNNWDLLTFRFVEWWDKERKDVKRRAGKLGAEKRAAAKAKQSASLP